MPKIKWILKKFSKTFKILPKWQNFAKSGHTVMMIDLCMEHFSRRTWTTRSAQQPSLHGIIPCKCYIFCMVLSFLQHSTTWADKSFIYLKGFMTSVTSKKMQNDYIKVAQKWFHYKNERFQTPLQKNSPKSNKSPNLVTLFMTSSYPLNECLFVFRFELICESVFCRLLLQLCKLVFEFRHLFQRWLYELSLHVTHCHVQLVDLKQK